MSTAQPSTSNTAQTYRLVAGSLMGALGFIALAMWFVLGTAEGGLATPPVWVPLAQVAAGVGVHLLLEQGGYQAQALPTGLDEDEALRRALAAWQPGMMLRFLLCEAIAIASLAVAFVVTEGGFVTFAVGAVVSVVLMLFHVWPGSRPVGRIADRLERDGQPSGLREAFGHAGHGPIQEL